MSTVTLSAKDYRILGWAVDYILSDVAWADCPQIETRVRHYVTTLFRLSRLKFETAEKKILLAEPFLLSLVKERQREQQKES